MERQPAQGGVEPAASVCGGKVIFVCYQSAFDDELTWTTVRSEREGDDVGYFMKAAPVCIVQLVDNWTLWCKHQCQRGVVGGVFVLVLSS